MRARILELAHRQVMLAELGICAHQRPMRDLVCWLDVEELPGGVDAPVEIAGIPIATGQYVEHVDVLVSAMRRRPKIHSS